MFCWFCKNFILIKHQKIAVIRIYKLYRKAVVGRKCPECARNSPFRWFLDVHILYELTITFYALPARSPQIQNDLKMTK